MPRKFLKRCCHRGAFTLSSHIVPKIDILHPALRQKSCVEGAHAIGLHLPNATRTRYPEICSAHAWNMKHHAVQRYMASKGLIRICFFHRVRLFCHRFFRLLEPRPRSISIFLGERAACRPLHAAPPTPTDHSGEDARLRSIDVTGRSTGHGL